MYNNLTEAPGSAILRVEQPQIWKWGKRMGEVRQTNFRVDQDTADKFREFCAAALKMFILLT